MSLRSPWIAVSLIVALGVASSAMAVALGGDAREGEVTALEPAWPITFAVVGGIVASRARNVVGWLLVLIGASGSVMIASGVYTAAAQAGRVPVGPSALVNDWAWATTFPLLFLLVQLYPDGRPVGPRWRPLVALTMAWPIALAAVLRLSPVALSGGEPVPNPDGLTGPVGAAIAEVLVPALLLAFVGLLVASVVAALQRLRRARGIERQQLKWFAYSATGVFGLFVLGDFAGLLGDWPRVTGPLVLSLLPVSVGIAVFRYRLYDIDVLINRTLVYGALSGALATIYFAGVVLFQAALRPLTGGGEIAVAGSTLLVVAIFQPLRRRIQDAVDRRFYRARYDAQRTVDVFADRLRDQVDLDDLRHELVAALDETVRPRSASLWLRPANPRAR